MGNCQNSSQSSKPKLLRFLSSIGPGIFILGYIIGTGSVTTMASAGAKYGMSMTWALGLSCFFTYIMIVSTNRSTIISGQTLIYCFKQKFGSPITIFLIFGLMMTVIPSVMGLVGIATDLIREWTKFLIPNGNGLHPVISAVIFSGLLYFYSGMGLMISFSKQWQL